MAKLEYVEGVGKQYADKLSAISITSTDELLKAGATPYGRSRIAAQSGISPALILEWVNHVDLFRLKGVGEEYADLLEEAGVDTIPELAMRNPANLHNRLQEINLMKSLVRRLPSLNMVQSWVNQAKFMPRVVKY